MLDGNAVEYNGFNLGCSGFDRADSTYVSK
jgi:hypothetical protein